MKFIFEGITPDSRLVESIWRTQSEGSGSFISLAESHWGLVVTRHEGQLNLTIRGPETRAEPAPVPENAEFFGIIFKLDTFMPHHPASQLVDRQRVLPSATDQTFWLNGSACSCSRAYPSPMRCTRLAMPISRT